MPLASQQVRTFFVSFLLLLFAVRGEAKQLSSSGASSSQLFGAWRGQSVCVIKPSACHDEDSVYRISSSPQSDDRVVLSGNKIVDGKEVNMGTGYCTWHRNASTLDCPLPAGNALHLEVNGNSITGKMMLQDGTPWRKLSLKRDEQNRLR